MTFTFIVLLISSFQAIAQTLGGYQSAASGNWNAASIWLRHNGISFVGAVVAPSNSDEVITIKTGHTVTVNSGVTTDQTIVDAGGVFTLTSSLTVANGAGDDLTVNGTFNFTSGNITGPGTINITGGLDWQGGSIQTNVILTSTATSSKTTAGNVSIGNPTGVLTNNGAFTWAAGNIDITNGSFSNSATGTINITRNNAMNTDGGSRFFNNAGTVTKSTGTGTV